MFQKIFNKNPFPFYRQSDAMDCGPTCLKMIAAYYGKVYPLQYLRNACHISRQGVTFADMIAAAEQLGFKTLPAELPFAVLAQKAPLPCILHWDKQHFVVLYHITETQVYVADPALGRRSRYSIPEFMAAWQVSEEASYGRALFLEPGPAFHEATKIQEPTASVKLLWPYLKAHRKSMLPVMLTLLLASIFSLLTPLLTQAIMDKGIQGRQVPLLLLIGAGLLALFLGRMIADFIRARLLLQVGARISMTMLKDFLHKLLRLPISFFDNRQAGDNMQRVTDNQRVEDFLTVSLISFVLSVVTILVLGGVLLYYNGLVFILFMAGAAIGMLWTWAFRERRSRLDQKRFRVLAANQDMLLEMFSAMQEIRLTGSETGKTTQWENIQERSIEVKLESLRLDQLVQGVALFINETRNVLVTCFSAILVVNGQLTLGAMLAITYTCGQLSAPVAQLTDFIRALQNTRFSLRRMSEVHHEADEDSEQQPELSLAAVIGQDIRLEKVSFRYGHKFSPLILQNLDLVIPAGKVTAIVGMSGSGKTTLLKLLLKFYQPPEGTVWLGKTPLQQYSAKSWRQHCGVVMQDGYVFRDTIANNIFSGTGTRDYQRLYEACRMACIHDFFTTLPFGYETLIGKDGYGLSEGQTQRLLIARLIYRNPAVVLLDEATNSLDAHNERAIINNLQEFFIGKTVVVVAHRLSTVKHADQILVMDKGVIVESGTHQTLASSGGAYYQLVKNQLELGK
ncbi:peptidase domain-containing ABC transporter [Chitinophaga flava]|uniref:ABC transporter ATP-binding protein n=1 Tax=Chitinophaga flava TaxID=2259036 RepID=A0A365XSL1_9BACT|nr:peptidase domain-containing ABC transporter [Chitinophaga flava]RBL89120.1 ABC transporter ATP-binding protein [Chitinophaga flava]